jgi:hypothetical protein
VCGGVACGVAWRGVVTTPRRLRGLYGTYDRRVYCTLYLLLAPKQNTDGRLIALVVFVQDKPF